jgi:hypothetical protein
MRREKRAKQARRRAGRKERRQRRAAKKKRAKHTAEPPVAAIEEEFIETHCAADLAAAETVSDTDTISITQAPFDPAGDGRQ